jgi:hypothetical protein
MHTSGLYYLWLNMLSNLRSPEIEQPEDKAQYTPQPLSAQVKNTWSFISSSLTAFVAVRVGRGTALPFCCNQRSFCCCMLME